MKLRRLVESVIVYGFLAVCFNYVFLPINKHIYLTLLKKNLIDRNIQQVCKVDDHLDDIVANLKKDSELLSVLKSAHALSLKWLEYEHVSIFGEFKTALEKGEAKCSYFSAFTYSNFLYLSDKLGKPELKDKVRLCDGCIVDEEGELDSLHAWLQVYLNNKWRNYETTVDPIKKNHNLKFKNLDDILPNWEVLDYGEYKLFSYLKFENDKFVGYTNLSASLESGIDYWDFVWKGGKNLANQIDGFLKEKKLN